MDQKNLNHFKALFREIKKSKALKELADQTDAITWNNGDDADKVHFDRDQQMGLKLQGRQNFYLKKVDSALERIEDGCFGECHECGDDISLNRIYARPTATQCITCKEDNERVETQIRYDKKSHTHGKTFINNVVTLPQRPDAMDEEKVLKFNRSRISNTTF